MSTPLRPRNQHDFRVAILCALPLEAGMVRLVFDKNWTDDGFDVRQREEDRNAYTVGLIGKHNVVLVHMAGMGSTDATTAALGLRATFPRIDVVFVVGICGAAPGKAPQEIFLGDCILSTALIRYDFGRQYPGQFQRKTNVEDSLGRARPEVRALLARLQALGTPQAVETRLALHLQELQERESKPSYPGVHRDRLFDPTYLHTHRSNESKCDKCIEGFLTCTEDCSELGCDVAYLIPRASLAEYENTQKQRTPRLHFGRYGSANTVLKSGVDRDEYTEKDEIIAFEMEAAGVWEEYPTLVVKSACDYADSHKNKEWQGYAAASAAAGLKSILEYWRVLPLSSDQATEISNTSSSNQHINEADEFIRRYYRSGDRLLIKRLSGQELELEKCYINLALIDRSAGSKNEDPQASFSLEARLRLDSSHVGQSVLLDNLFEVRETANGRTINPRRIFIQGRAGIGKTTLCKKIVYEFLEGRLGSSLFDRLLWIPLRGLKPDQDEYEWPELLRDTFKFSSRLWKRVGEEYSIQFEQPDFLSRTLFLFDGLDEISHRWMEEEPLYQFINTIIRDLPNVIITSRPQANTFSFDRFDLDLETVGFTRDQVSIYIENCVKDAGKAARMRRMIAQKPLIRDLLRIPIQLDAFCFIYTEGDASNEFEIENSITMTSLYRSITIELCRKDSKRLGKLVGQRRPPSSEIEKHLEAELALLGDIAFQGLINNIAEFSPQNWDKLGNYLYKAKVESSTAIVYTLDRVSFLRTADYEQDHVHRSYHFIHLTFQEFFAARHFADHWRRDEPLTCLQMISGIGLDIKTPIRFLREERYHPRYNIFWRFVTGLLSEYDVVNFFQHLHFQPKDLIGATHRRLAMYCLSEVSHSEHNLRGLRSIEETRLSRELVEEYYTTGLVMLGTASEFPESLLSGFLQNELQLPYVKTLWMFEQRSTMQAQTAELLVYKLEQRYEMEIRLTAVRILLKHIAVCSDHVARRAFEFLYEAVKDEDDHVRESAVHLLGQKSSLPQLAIDALLEALKDDVQDVRLSAVTALRNQTTLSKTSIDVLVKLLFQADERKWESAEVFSGSLSPLSEGVINNIIAMVEQTGQLQPFLSLMEVQPSISAAVMDVLIIALERGTLDERLDVLKLLSKQLYLPETVIRAVIAASDVDNHLVQAAGMRVLTAQSSAPAFVVAELERWSSSQGFSPDFTAKDILDEELTPTESKINALSTMVNSNDRIQRAWGMMKLANCSILPQELFDALESTIEHDDDGWIRYIALRTLRNCESPSRDIIDVLIKALKDDFDKVRISATAALRKQSTLPERGICALIEALKDESEKVRLFAAVALSKQSVLPERGICALIEALKDESKRVRSSIVETLGDSSILDERGIFVLMEALNNEFENVVELAALVLGCQSSLSERGIFSLIACLKDQRRSVRFEAAMALQNHSPLPEEAVAALENMNLNGEHQIYDVLSCQKLFYHRIRNLAERDWVGIWDRWLSSGVRQDTSCYLLNGSLQLWSNGSRYQISTECETTIRMLMAVLDVPHDELQRMVAESYT